MSFPYVPDIGDIIWLDFDPSAGHEQAGHRPALVLSPKLYNINWRARRESNPQPSDPKSDALSIELRAHPTVFFTYFQWSVNP